MGDRIESIQDAVRDYIVNWAGDIEPSFAAVGVGDGRIREGDGEVVVDQPTGETVSVGGDGGGGDGDFSGSHDDLSDVSADDHHAKYTDSDARESINADPNHATSADHDYFSGSHDDLSGVSADDHHAEYTDAEAVAAVEAEDPLEVAGDLELGSNKSSGLDTIYTTNTLNIDIDNDDTNNGSTLRVNHHGGDRLLLVRDDGTLRLVGGGPIEIGGSTVESGDPVSPDTVSDAHHAKYTDPEAVSAVESADLTLQQDLTINEAADSSLAFHETGTEKANLYWNESTSEFVLDVDSGTDVLHADTQANVDIVNGSLEVGGNTAISGVVASGSTTLSSGSATVDTGVSSGTTATFQVALGPATDDSEVSASIQAVSGGNYEVHLDEINTSVGNPTVNYDVLRVR